MKDSKCRFIEEYANFQIRQYKKDATLYDYDAERMAFAKKLSGELKRQLKWRGQA